MANKRMFAKEIIQCDEFLDMPLGSQALYFHLGMNADDDGFVQPKSVMRLCQAKDDELKILIAKGFIIPFENMVVVITHWHINNYLQNDRYKPTMYQELLKQLTKTENKTYNKINELSVLDTHCIQPVYNLEAQYSIDKGRLEEKRIDKVNILSDVIDYFNTKTNKSKYQKGSERATLQKYIQTMIKNGDTLDTITNLIDYKLANPNTQKIDLLSWLTPMYVGKNISDAESWKSSGKTSITKYNDSKAKQSNHDLSKQDYSRGAEILGHRVNNSDKPF